MLSGIYVGATRPVGITKAKGAFHAVSGGGGLLLRAAR